jgi:hypothetical protein
LTEVLTREARCDEIARREGLESADVLYNRNIRKLLFENALRSRLDLAQERAPVLRALESQLDTSDSREKANDR